jgi:preprotein translocase subunit SecB
MSMPTNGGTPTAPPEGAPQLGVLTQYIKDFSFENPNAPRSLSPSAQPSINVQVGVNANPLGGSDHEIEIKLEGRAEVSGMVMFSFELLYAGMFRIQNIPQEQMHPLLMIECPRLLFPFAREIIATAVRNGGFPPLLLEPIDFVALYQQRQMQPPGATPSA